MTFEMTHGFGESWVGLSVDSDGRAQLFIGGDSRDRNDGSVTTQEVPIEEVERAIRSLVTAYRAAVASYEKEHG